MILVAFLFLAVITFTTVAPFSMASVKGNLYADIPDGDRIYPKEIFHRMLHTEGPAPPSIHIDRIVSTGQTTEYTSQDDDEWVILLKGNAVVMFQEVEGGEEEAKAVSSGDYLYIPRGTRHRVSETSSSPAAVWLAVHSMSSLVTREHTVSNAQTKKELLGMLLSSFTAD